MTETSAQLLTKIPTRKTGVWGTRPILIGYAVFVTATQLVLKFAQTEVCATDGATDFAALAVNRLK